MISYRIIIAMLERVVCTKKTGIVGQIQSLPHLLLSICLILLNWLLLLRPIRIGVMIRVLSTMVRAISAAATAPCAWSRIGFFIIVRGILAFQCYGLVLLMLRGLRRLLMLILLL